MDVKTIIAMHIIALPHFMLFNKFSNV